MQIRVTTSRSGLLMVVLVLSSLGLLSFFLVSAPLAFYLEGQAVYQWPDYRITALEVSSIVALLGFAAASKPATLRPLASACLAFAAANLFLFVIFNYGTNAPDGVLPQLFSPNAAMTAMNVMDSMRLSPVYGLAAQTIAWYAATVFSFFALRYSDGLVQAFLDAMLLGSSVLAVYALGVHLVIPQWSMREVTGLQAGTAISWITNDDLFIVGVIVSAGVVLVKYRRSRMGRTPAPAKMAEVSQDFITKA